MNKILCIIGLMLMMVVVAAAYPRGYNTFNTAPKPTRVNKRALARGLKRCAITVNRLKARAIKQKRTEWSVNFADPRIKPYSVESKNGRFVCVPKKSNDRYITKTTFVLNYRL
jgi:hypothetical protein